MAKESKPQLIPCQLYIQSAPWSADMSLAIELHRDVIMQVSINRYDYSDLAAVNKKHRESRSMFLKEYCLAETQHPGVLLVVLFFLL